MERKHRLTCSLYLIPWPLYLSPRVPALIYRKTRRRQPKLLDRQSDSERNDPVSAAGRDWVCALRECVETSRPRVRPGLNLDTLPLSTREFLRLCIKAWAKKLSIYCARGVDTR